METSVKEYFTKIETRFNPNPVVGKSDATILAVVE